MLFCVATSTFGQSYFSKRYSYENSFTLDFCHTLLQTNDGYILPGGFVTYDSLAYNRGGIIETDRFGNELLKKQLYFPLKSCDIARQPGSFQYDMDSTGYFSVGMNRVYNIPNAVGLADYGVIFRYNLQMDTLWTKSLGDEIDPIDSTFIFEHCDVMKSNNLIICGTVVIEGETSTVFMIKTDSLGNELWRKYFSSGPLNKAYNVIATPDGGFALSVWKWVFGPQPVSTPFLIKTDSAGNEQWRKYFGGVWNDGPMFIGNSPDSTIVGGYIYCDTMDYSDDYNRDAIVKLNLDGTVLWEKMYGETTYIKRNSSVNVNSEGKIILSGYNYSPFPHRVGYLLNVSSDGDSLWYREYEKVTGQYDANYLYAVIPTDDGGYAASGMVHTDYDQDIWVLKVDSLGCESSITAGHLYQALSAWKNRASYRFFPTPPQDIAPSPSPKKTSLKLIRCLYTI
ncbi:MAG: hypothetical protein WC341_15795 [Bacteroidales bacterium]